MDPDGAQSAVRKNNPADRQLFAGRSVVIDKDRDAALVADCLNGDRDAMNTLVTHYEKPVFNAAFRILGNTQDAADVCQTAFMKAFEKLNNYDPRYKFFSWLYRIAVNESVSALKSRKPGAPYDVADLGSVPGPEQAHAGAAVDEIVQSVLMKLPHEQRILVALKHFSELSYRDIAIVLDVPEKTVKSRLYTARQQMKKELVSLGVRPE